MTDLVKRLRDRLTYDELHYAPDPLLAEAADRIEELERKVERLTYDGIHTCSDQCERIVCVLRRQIEELEGWKAAEEAHHHLLKRRIAELEAKIKKETEND